MTTHDLSNPIPNAGDGFRDEVANLLSVRFGEVKTEYREEGKKADVFFEYRDFGTKVRVYCECKDYDARLARSEIVHIWTDYWLVAISSG
jgi:hypothetical protein